MRTFFKWILNRESCNEKFKISEKRESKKYNTVVEPAKFRYRRQSMRNNEDPSSLEHKPWRHDGVQLQKWRWGNTIIAHNHRALLSEQITMQALPFGQARQEPVNKNLSVLLIEWSLLRRTSIQPHEQLEAYLDFRIPDLLYQQVARPSYGEEGGKWTTSNRIH